MAWQSGETCDEEQDCLSHGFQVIISNSRGTRNAAWACHSEDEIGSLELGKFADLVVLERDPREVEPTAISDTRVSETWMNGNRVFQS
jgi:imidazolonepropionase-like amidohydrolase